MKSREKLRQFATIIGLLYILLLDPVTSAPVTVEESEYEVDGGCYYMLDVYKSGEQIRTNEPCLNCTCAGTRLMCYLQTCPFSKPVGERCSVERIAGQCCPTIRCPEVPVMIPDHVLYDPPATALASVTSTTAPVQPVAPSTAEEGCYLEDSYFVEGSRVPPTSDDPCDLCYCIHNRTACVKQQCLLEIPGCRPKYQADACCPYAYDCDESLGLTPSTPSTTTTTTTTIWPTLGCYVDDIYYYDGSVIPTGSPCEHCYCMQGKLVCAMQDCQPPVENCLPVYGDDQCCPERYDCATTPIPQDVGASGVSYATVAPPLDRVPEPEATPEPSAGDAEAPSTTWSALAEQPVVLADDATSRTDAANGGVTVAVDVTTVKYVPTTEGTEPSEVRENEPSESIAVAQDATTEEPVEDPIYEFSTQPPLVREPVAPSKGDAVDDFVSSTEPPSDDSEVVTEPASEPEPSPVPAQQPQTEKLDRITTAAPEPDDPATTAPPKDASDLGESFDTTRDAAESTTPPILADLPVSPASSDDATSKEPDAEQDAPSTPAALPPEVATSTATMLKTTTPVAPQDLQPQPSETPSEAGSTELPIDEGASDGPLEDGAPESLATDSVTSEVRTEPPVSSEAPSHDRKSSDEPVVQDAPSEASNVDAATSGPEIPSETPSSATTSDVSSDDVTSDDGPLVEPAAGTPAQGSTKAPPTVVPASEAASKVHLAISSALPDVTDSPSSEALYEDRTDADLKPEVPSSDEATPSVHPSSETSSVAVPSEVASVDVTSIRQSGDAATEAPASDAPFKSPTDEIASQPPSDIGTVAPPFDESASKSPFDDAASEVPSSASASEAPSSDSASQIPAVASATEAPSSDSASEVPSSDAASEVPSIASPSEIPPSASASEAPSSDSTSEFPSRYGTEAPSSDTASDVPSRDSASESPSVDIASQPPSGGSASEATIDDSPSEAYTGDDASEAPSSDNASEAPSDESASKAPPSGNASEAPSDESASKAPSSDSASEAPSDESASELPSSESASELPSSDSASVAPSSDNALKEPSADSASEASSDESASEVPSSDGASVAPSDDGASVAPSDDGASVAPSDDGASVAPSDDGASVAPSDDGASVAPSDDGASVAPSGDDASEAPSDEGSSGVPSSESASEAPSDDSRTRIPTDASATTVPSIANASVAIVGGSTAPVQSDVRTTVAPSDVESTKSPSEIPLVVDKSSEAPVHDPSPVTTEAARPASRAPEDQKATVSPTGDRQPDQTVASSETTTEAAPVREGTFSLPPEEVPGEGNCDQDGVTYQTGQRVPRKNPCQENCMCKGSVVVCDRVQCTVPDLVRNLTCTELLEDGRCCPTYVCHEPVTASHGPIAVGSFVTEPATTAAEERIDEHDSTTLKDEEKDGGATDAPVRPPTTEKLLAADPDVSVHEATYPPEDSAVDATTKEAQKSLTTEPAPQTVAAVTVSSAVASEDDDEETEAVDAVFAHTFQPLDERGTTAQADDVAATSDSAATEQPAEESSSAVDVKPSAPTTVSAHQPTIITRIPTTALPDVAETTTIKDATGHDVHAVTLSDAPKPSADVEPTPPNAKPFDYDITSQASVEASEDVETPRPSARPSDEDDTPQPSAGPYEDVEAPQPSVRPSDDSEKHATSGPAAESPTTAALVQDDDRRTTEASVVALTSVPASAAPLVPESATASRPGPEAAPADLPSTVQPESEPSKSRTPEGADDSVEQTTIYQVFGDDHHPAPTTHLSIELEVSQEEQVTTHRPAVTYEAQDDLKTTAVPSDLPATPSSSPTTAAPTFASEPIATTTHRGALPSQEPSTDRSTPQSEKSSTTLPPQPDVTEVASAAPPAADDAPLSVTRAPEVGEEVPRTEPATEALEKSTADDVPLVVQQSSTPQVVTIASTVASLPSTTSWSVHYPELSTRKVATEAQPSTTARPVEYPEASTLKATTAAVPSYDDRNATTAPPAALDAVTTQRVEPVRDRSTYGPLLVTLFPEISTTSAPTTSAVTTQPSTAYPFVMTTTAAPLPVRTTPPARPEEYTTRSPVKGDGERPQEPFPDVGVPILSDNFTLEEGECVYESRIYSSAQQIPRHDPCDFCFCFRGDIICLQQSCPPPIEGCHEESIPGFCCPRYECPVTAVTLNLSDSKAPYPVGASRYRTVRALTQVQVIVCEFRNKFYSKGESISPASGPCMDCLCGEGGAMKCIPKKCQLDPFWHLLPALKRLGGVGSEGEPYRVGSNRDGRNRF